MKRSAAITFALALLGTMVLGGAPAWATQAAPEPAEFTAELEEDASEQEAPDEPAANEEPSEEPVEEESAEESSSENSRDGPAKDEDAEVEATDGPETADVRGDDGDENENVELNNLTPMSEHPQDTWVNDMDFQAYVGAGESLDVFFSRIANVGGAGATTITVEGPGVAPVQCTMQTVGDNCSWQDLTGDPGVWQVSIAGTVGNNHHDWQIDVRQNGSALDGRVWTEMYNMRQSTATGLADFTFWYLTEDGYLYEASYGGFNGINSTFRSDSTGVRYNGTCTSAYASIVYSDQVGEIPDPDRSPSGVGECGDPYKIFFEPPATDLPETATRWDGAADWIVPPILDPAITDVTFTPDSVVARSGVIDYEVENFTGQLAVEIDTNGDGVFDVTIPGSAAGGVGSVNFDGLDGNGDPVSPFQDLPIRVSIAQVGEVHFMNADVEVRSGGLEVVRLNGPASGDATLYWNDTELSTTHPCGTWDPRLDGRGGVDSTGGVHWWDVDEGCDGIAGGWGDARIIDEWTFVPVDVSMSIVVPAHEPEPWICTPDGLLFQYPGAVPPTQVQFVDLLTGDVDVAEVVIEGRTVNAAAYNVVDDFVYGWDNELVGGGPERTGVVRIGADGSAQTLGVPDHPELNAEDSFPVGDIDNNGHYWVSNAVGSTAHVRWYQIDLNPGATFMEVLNWGTVQGGDMPDSGVWGLSGDWAWVPGGGDNLWRVMRNSDTGNWRLWRFDMATGMHHNVALLPQLNSEGVSTFGAAFADEEFLYVSNNVSGNIYRIDVQDFTASLFVQDGPPSGNNDGARCAIAPIYTDYGDAPDSYGTLLDSDGPRHGLRDYDPDTDTTSLMLGENVSHETDGQPSDEADLDTFDDGVSDPIVLVPGEPVSVDVFVTNNTGDPATLAGWVDLDGTGTFDASDRSEVVTVPANTSDTFTLTFGEASTESDTYARFRLYGGEVDDPSPLGAARSGEVEDYLVQYLALDVDKTSDATVDSRPGDTLTYEVTLTNSGTSDYTAEFPAFLHDDLSGVLDDATLDETSIAADRPGALDFTDPIISWEGELAAGDSVVVTYQVTLTGDGDGVVRNVAFVPDCDPADPDCEPVTPECNPPDENGRDPQTGLPCAENEFELPRLEIEKTADQTDLPAVGETVTYTVIATNVGPGDYTADSPAVITDNLSDVLDDATLDESSLSADHPGTLEFNDPFITWEGVLLADESVTITYTVTYTGEGDHILINTACVPEEQTAPDTEPCDTVGIPAAFVVETKSVEASEDPVQAGTVLTYTLTFENIGQAPGTVDTVDDLTHVLDDGDVAAGPDVSDPALSVEGLDANRFHITGTLDPDQTVTVTYEVTLRPDGERGDNRALNFLLDPDEDPLCDPDDPECEPPPCEDGDPTCTETLVSEIVESKSVEASEDPVQAGTVLTYTLTFENLGEGPGTVDTVDDLTHVLDDGDVAAGPDVSDPALSVAGLDANRFHITGTLDAGQTVTVTYEVTLRPDGERGDNRALNFLLDPDEDPLCDPDDPECEPPPCEDGDPTCTETPIGEIDPSKSVDPDSGTTVEAGDVLTYTLTFENVGEASAVVNYDDVVAGVLDDADLTDGPATSSDALTVAGPEDGRIMVTGTLEPGQVETVTYQVTVKPDGERGDNLLGNFLVDEGEEPPEECDADDPRCTENPVPEVRDWKSVDPASGTPVTGGAELTYTLTFTNDGTAAGEVARVDDLTHVLDDAELIDGPTVSDAALDVSGPDGDNRITVTGHLDPGEMVTVTYTIQVRDAEDRGDDILANFLLDPDQETPDPEDCVPATGEDADCTRNPIGNITAEKSVDPESGTEVVPGDELTYTLTFTNHGQGEDEVDFTDHAAGIADDTVLIDGPNVFDDALSVSGPDDENRFHITGTLGAGETVTVSYTVRVKPYDEQGDGLLMNFLVPDGQEPPSDCVESNPLCTENPIKEPPGEKPPGEDPPGKEPPKQPRLPDTGSGLAGWVLVAGLVLLFAGLSLAATTRRRTTVTGGPTDTLV